MGSFVKTLPALGLVLLAAACGGKDAGSDQAPAEGTQAPAATEQTAAPAGQGQVVEVKMVTTQGGATGVFEPAEVSVKKGDIIRFTTDGVAAHNASFPAGENPAGATLPAAGPYLTTAGATYDVPITMEPGTYTYVCDPHAAMGMKGKITVTQ